MTLMTQMTLRAPMTLRGIQWRQYNSLYIAANSVHSEPYILGMSKSGSTQCISQQIEEIMHGSPTREMEFC